MVEECRNLNISSVSKMIKHGIENTNGFMEMSHEYTDYCACVDDPMDYKDFFE